MDAPAVLEMPEPYFGSDNEERKVSEQDLLRDTLVEEEEEEENKSENTSEENDAISAKNDVDLSSSAFDETGYMMSNKFLRSEEEDSL
jgi:hypothetical protein